MQLSKNFTREEFACKCCGFSLVDPMLIRGLQVLRDALRKPVVILSGCRCERHNERVGGAKFSQHLIGRAADIRVEGMSARELYAKAKDIPMLRGFGVDDERGFLHVDSRDVGARWCYRGGKQAPWFEVS